jgi:hypothetical protein
MKVRTLPSRRCGAKWPFVQLSTGLSTRRRPPPASIRTFHRWLRVRRFGWPGTTPRAAALGTGRGRADCDHPAKGPIARKRVQAVGAAPNTWNAAQSSGEATGRCEGSSRSSLARCAWTRSATSRAAACPALPASPSRSMNRSMCGPICSAFSLRSHWAADTSARWSGASSSSTANRKVISRNDAKSSICQLGATHGLLALLEQQGREAPRLVGDAAARAASLADAEHHRVSVVQPVDIARPRDPTMTSVARTTSTDGRERPGETPARCDGRAARIAAAEPILRPADLDGASLSNAKPVLPQMSHPTTSCRWSAQSPLRVSAAGQMPSRGMSRGVASGSRHDGGGNGAPL